MLAVPRWTFNVVDMWMRCRRSGGISGGHMLPDAGGMADQPAALMDAFDLLDMMLAADHAD